MLRQKDTNSCGTSCMELVMWMSFTRCLGKAIVVITTTINMAGVALGSVLESSSTLTYNCSNRHGWCCAG